MISSVLDQVQRLFGRGFLIAALVPCLLFVAAVQTIWTGFSGLHALLTQWAEGDLKAAGADLILAAGGVYLLAYTLYGVRPALHRAYQGRWPAPFRRFSRSGLFEAGARRRSRRHLDELTSVLDVPMWAEKQHFGAAYSERGLTPRRMRRLLRQAERRHRKLVVRLAVGKPLDEHAYFGVLVNSHLLAANRRSASPDAGKRIDLLLQQLSASYSEHGAMRTAVRQLRVQADRDRIAAYQDFVSTFPVDDRLVRPTRLGNVMSVAEGWTLSRYGITLDDLWPRLLHVTPAESANRVDEANTYLDFTVMMSLLSLATAGVSALAAAYGPPRTTLAAWLAPLLALAGFWIFYRLAIQAARRFVLQVQAVVDLFRLHLLDALNIERPGTPQEEQPIWTELRRFVVQGEVPVQHIRFTQPAEKVGERTG